MGSETSEKNIYVKCSAVRSLSHQEQLSSWSTQERCRKKPVCCEFHFSLYALFFSFLFVCLHSFVMLLVLE